jgi:hypothetical protein
MEMVRQLGSWILNEERYTAGIIDMNTPPQLQGHFRLYSPACDPDAVTAIVGLQPTRQWHKGDPIGRSTLRYQHGGWEIMTKEVEEFDCRPLVCALVDGLRPHTEKIIAARHELSLDALLGCYVTVRADRQYPDGWFPPEVMQWVAAIGAAFEVDFM